MKLMTRNDHKDAQEDEDIELLLWEVVAHAGQIQEKSKRLTTQSERLITVAERLQNLINQKEGLSDGEQGTVEPKRDSG